jgi:hypothetical protein
LFTWSMESFSEFPIGVAGRLPLATPPGLALAVKWMCSYRKPHLFKYVANSSLPFGFSQADYA